MIPGKYPHSSIPLRQRPCATTRIRLELTHFPLLGRGETTYIIISRQGHFCLCVLHSLHYPRPCPTLCPQRLTSYLLEASLFVPLARVSFAHPSPGGTTACVIAGRLAAADPSLKILVVESGQHSRDLPRHVQPCRFIEHLAPDSTTVTFHVAKPSPHLNGRAAVVPCGRSVGGGSVVNCKFKQRITLTRVSSRSLYIVLELELGCSHGVRAGCRFGLR